MKQKKLIFNFFVNRNWKKLIDSRKRAKILAHNRKGHHPIETPNKRENLLGLSPGGLTREQKERTLHRNEAAISGGIELFTDSAAILNLLDLIKN